MTQVRVEAKPDFLETLTVSARPLNALAELVWNGFDAGSEKVQVFFEFNELDAIDSKIGRAHV